MLNKKIERLFFYLMWIGIIVSINTNSSLIYLKSYKFFEIINFLRALAPLVIFSILVLYILINIKNLNFFKDRNIYLNIICICILFYTTVSILGLFLNNDQFFFDRIWWNISYLNVIFYLYLGSYFFGDKFLKNIFLILLLFIFCFYVSIAFMAIKESVIYNIKNVYHSRLLSPNTYFLSQGVPRTSGVARALFFLFLLHFSLLCFKKNYFYINLFICSLYAFAISVLDSRITALFFFISLLVIFYSKLNFLKKIGIFLILNVIFIYSGNIYKYILILQSKNIEYEKKYQKRTETTVLKLYEQFAHKKELNNVDKKELNNVDKNVDKKELNNVDKKEVNKKIFNNKNNIKEDKLRLDHVSKDTLSGDKYGIIFFQKKIICDVNHFINANSSGRLCIWIDNLNTALKNYSVFLFGYGAQADRYNVKYSSIVQELSVSNTFLYVLTSGGAISVIFVLVVYIIFFMNFLKYFVFTKEKLLNKSTILISCLLMNSFILFRGITETSFAMFSLDYMLFLITAFIIFSNKNFNYYKKK